MVDQDDYGMIVAGAMLTADPDGYEEFNIWLDEQGFGLPVTENDFAAVQADLETFSPDEKDEARELYREFMEQVATKHKDDDTEWTPYIGPEGGTGWQNTQDPDEVSYDDEPPGQVEGLEDDEEFEHNPDPDSSDLANEGQEWVLATPEGQPNRLTVEHYNEQAGTVETEVGVIDEENFREYVVGEVSGGGDGDELEELNEYQAENLSPGDTINIDGEDAEVQFANSFSLSVEYDDGSTETINLEDEFDERDVARPDQTRDTEDSDLSDEEIADYEESYEYVDDKLTKPGQSQDEVLDFRDNVRDVVSSAFEEEMAGSGVRDAVVENAPNQRVASTAFTDAIDEILRTESETGVELRGSADLRQADQMERAFKDENPQYDDIDLGKAFDQWTQSASKTATAPLWEIARQETGNENYHDYLDVNPESYVGEDEYEAMQAYAEWSQDRLREMYGDSVPAYRGRNDSSREVRDAVESGDPAEHRALESWSTNPVLASKFAGNNGIVYETEIPVEDIVASHLNGAGKEEEAEIVPMLEEQKEWDEDQIHDFEQTDKAEAERQMADDLFNWMREHQ